MDECVSLFRAKLNSVFEILADVAVTEITHIYLDTIRNVREPAAGVRSPHGTQTQQSVPLLESRLRSSLRALHTQGGVNEGLTEDGCVSLKAESQDVPDGPVTTPPVPTLEGATVLDVPLKTETESMEWEEATSNMKNSLFQGNEECRSHLFPGPRIVSSTSLGGQVHQDGCTVDKSLLLLLCEKENVLNTSYTETASEMRSEPITLIVSLKEKPLELHKMEAACVGILTEQDHADEKEPMEGHIKVINICTQSEQDQVEKLETESAFTGQKVCQSVPVHATVVDDPEELSNSYSTEQRNHTFPQEELCGPSVCTEDTEGNIPTISSREAIESPLLPITHHHTVTTQAESNGQHMPAPERKDLDEATPQKRRYPIRSRRPSRPFSFSSRLSSPPALTSTLEQKYLKSCSVALVKMQCFTCKECGKIFRKERHLRRHFRFHTGEKPFSCKECSRTFAIKKNLEKHNRYHNGEKRHKCKYCKKQFCSSKKLKIHIRFHTGEKPYGCNLCKKSYRKKSSLKKHIVKHSGNAQLKDQTKLDG